MSSKNYYVNGNTVRELIHRFDTIREHAKKSKRQDVAKTVEMQREGIARERWR